MVKFSRKLVCLLICMVLVSGCANYGTYKQRKAERAQEKVLRKQQKELEIARKRHFRMQHPDVQKRMKESELRYKRYQRQRNRRSLWDRIFR
ncbi:MAG: hypothetical protein ACLFPE_10335 [Bacteroidales bacterium]